MRRRQVLAWLAGFAIATDASAATRLTEGQILRGRFIQERHLRGFDAPLRTEGSFVLVPGRGLIWRAETPFAITTVITASGLTQDVGGTETLRLPAGRVPFLNRLYVMLNGALSGDWTSIEAEFPLTRSGTDAAWQARLTPNRPGGADLALSAITLSGGRLVERVRIERPNGDADEITFHDQAIATARPRPDEDAMLSSAGR